MKYFKLNSSLQNKTERNILIWILILVFEACFMAWKYSSLNIILNSDHSIKCRFTLYNVLVIISCLIVSGAAIGGVLQKMLLLRISQNFQENTSVGVSLLIKLQVSDLQLCYKRDSNRGVFLWILRIFLGQLFHRTPLGDCFCCFDFEISSLDYWG